MGHLLFYKDYDHDLGDVSIGRWREIQRLLPLLVEYVNRAMTQDWHPGTRQNVTVYTDGSLQPCGDLNVAKPSGSPFILAGIIRDESNGLNEIYVEDADELVRLFAWYEYLAARDGAASLYAPLVAALRSCTRGIEFFTSNGTA